MNIEQIGKIAHELNKSYCAAIGDDSQLSWEDAPEWQKNSCLNGVKAHLDNPLLTPEQSHNLWLKQKSDEGWSYGPVKNAETKEHPCFRPYDELPADMKVKDYIFQTIVNQLAPFFFDGVDYEAQIEEISQKRKFFLENVYAIEDTMGSLDLTDAKKASVKDTLVRKYLQESNYLPELQELVK